VKATATEKQSSAADRGDPALLPPCEGWCHEREDPGAICMIDTKGYVYCKPCGYRLKEAGRRGVRRLRKREVEQLAARHPLDAY